MANPVKAAKRTRRALSKLSKKTSDRIEDVLGNQGMTADDVTKKIVEQFFDGVEAWVSVVRSFAEEPPTAFLKADISGGKKTTDKTIDLDEPAPLANLLWTDLISPGVASALKMKVTEMPPGAVGDLDQAKITIDVPANQDVGLYGGFISMGTVVQVKVYIWVHK